MFGLQSVMFQVHQGCCIQTGWDETIVASKRHSLSNTVAWTTPWIRHDCWQWRPHTAAISSTPCHSQTVDYAWMTMHVVAVRLWLGSNICESHQCPCGAEVDARGVRGLSCKGSSGRSTPHHSLTDLVWHGLSMANIHTIKELSGLLRSDGKWANRLSTVVVIVLLL